MTIPQILLYLMLVIYFASFWKIFEKAGRKKWEGLIPVYNTIVWLQIVKKPWWWFFMFYIPGINFLLAIGMNLELARMFGKYSAKDTLMAVFLPWYYIPYLALSQDEWEGELSWEVEEDRKKRQLSDHIGLALISWGVGHALVLVLRLLGSKDKEGKKTMVKEWYDALGFAIIAAALIRTFFFEAFTIPTGSMEKDLLIGDYLFVSKVSYGAKVPNTPLSFPFAHNRMPVLNTKSYLEWFTFGYHRLPGLGEVKRNDVVVFNFPAADSSINEAELGAHTFSQIINDRAFNTWLGNSGKTSYDPSYEKVKDTYVNSVKNIYRQDPGIVHRPVDKRDNYIKRCVGIPGDTIKIVDRVLYHGNNENPLNENAQFNYRFRVKTPFNEEKLKEKFDINYITNQVGQNVGYQYSRDGYVTLTLTAKAYNAISKYPNVVSAEVMNKEKGYYGNQVARSAMHSLKYFPIFPNHPTFDWTEDNFGPLYLPKKGDRVELTERNFILYRRAIEVYEENDVQQKDGKIFINGEEATHYTFKMGYYWMMGDNRHNSADCRMWGYVPEDHVVGKAGLIWMSKDPQSGFRWDRIFNFIHD